jgi:hypothetical protein
VSALDLCVHYMNSGCLFHAVRVHLRWCELFEKSHRCPIMVENMVEGGPHLILDVDQGRVEC